jgi:hypothetical protein
MRRMSKNLGVAPIPKRRPRATAESFSVIAIESCIPEPFGVWSTKLKYS